jgi:two-component system, NarL family, nitrate/nitrite response regulator NarL
LVANIELLLRPRLVKDALLSVLTEAGFKVCDELGQPDNDTVAVIDFDGCKDPDYVRAHQQRGVKIVVLTNEADVQEIGAAEIAPLSGILTYDLSADAFAQSLRLIGAGERVFPSNMALDGRPRASSRSSEPPSDGVRLSPREKEILSHLVAGHANKLIARDLGITEATVKVHLKSVLRKIGVDNRTQAAIWALANRPEVDPAPRGFV